ncbi:MAG: L,D-transpeptidase family protein [Ilumatobacteraceae bacterium]
MTDSTDTSNDMSTDTGRARLTLNRRFPVAALVTLALGTVTLGTVALGLGVPRGAARASAAVPPTTPTTPTPPTTPPPTTAPPTTPPTTSPPTTPPPTTAPPTTAVITEVVTSDGTTITLAPNEEWVGAFPAPIPVVGKRGGNDTQIVQLRLLQLGFWLSGADGEYGLTTRQAVMAFQKYIGLSATGEVDQNTAAYLTNLGIKGHGQSDAGTLIEIDKGLQLLFVVVDGKTQWVYNTSTATGEPYEEEDKNTPGEIQKGISITPNGLWRVNRERPEGWWEGDLGKIYRPKYFRGGVAVHGSNSIPNYPASHGCVRVSVPAMDFIWASNFMPMKATVWVHEGRPQP